MNEAQTLAKTEAREGAPDEENYLSPIENLPDLVLDHIFSFLSVAEKVKIELVCKRWLEASRGSWIHLKRFDTTCVSTKLVGSSPPRRSLHMFEFKMICTFL